MSKARAPWVVRLRYAYADTLEAAGRDSDALTWFHRTHAIDSDEITDAAERADVLEKRLEQGWQPGTAADSLAHPRHIRPQWSH